MHTGLDHYMLPNVRKAGMSMVPGYTDVVISLPHSITARQSPI